MIIFWCVFPFERFNLKLSVRLTPLILDGEDFSGLWALSPLRWWQTSTSLPSWMLCWCTSTRCTWIWCTKMWFSGSSFWSKSAKPAFSMEIGLEPLRHRRMMTKRCRASRACVGDPYPTKSADLGSCKMKDPPSGFKSKCLSIFGCSHKYINGGTPKSSILIGFSIINYKPSIFGYPHLYVIIFISIPDGHVQIHKNITTHHNIQERGFFKRWSLEDNFCLGHGKVFLASTLCFPYVLGVDTPGILGGFSIFSNTPDVMFVLAMYHPQPH